MLGYGDNAYRVTDARFVHEAFFQETHSALIYQAVSEQPPQNIIEKVPSQNDPLTAWIPGYWEWDPDMRNYLWIGGVWRRPPPGHSWVPSFWLKIDDSWIRLRGFWKNERMENIHFIRDEIPEDLDETMIDPPNLDSFWIHGTWYYDNENKSFVWQNGRWESFDANWIYIPSFYVWRPDGYVNIEGYWDWPLDTRGSSYANITVERDNRNDVVYAPTQTVDVKTLINRLVPYYPDYVYLFWWHTHFYPNEWKGNQEIPFWWHWIKWWTFTWSDQWALWWWYGHPGYPAPAWVNEALAKKIPTPSNRLLAVMNRILPPSVVTPNGVVTQRKLIEEANKITNLRVFGKAAPILPADKTILNEIKTYVETNKGSTTIRPSAVVINNSDAMKAVMALKRVKVLPTSPPLLQGVITKPVVTSGQQETKMYEDQSLRGSIQQVTVPGKPVIPHNELRYVLPPYHGQQVR
jgi:hypothetical protein